jgi:hypothetical protein
MAEKWMQGTDVHPGGLHRSLHIPEGQKIPVARIEAATHSHNPLVKKQAVLAETFAHHRPGNETAYRAPQMHRDAFPAR